ncbi:nucleophile aminohydrolase [Scheffersomyces coipomensis]|uniref:nucleophile aminohydrolase n=1 Tax=Scheffersomyces coipomensis TaxID=1788519 RepID=UPI00315D52ED
MDTNIIRIVHIGAGNHSLNKSIAYKSLIRRCLKRSSTFEQSIEIIEASKLTNTGYGSSLNLVGQVECDASFIVIDDNGGRSQGSLTGIDVGLPGLVTMKVYDKINDLYKDDHNGLSKPLNMHYGSCPSFLKDDDDGTLISPESQHIYDIHKDRIFNDSGKLQEVNDTIGIIEVNQTTTKIVTSSGGSFFKLPGRIGCAGIIGCAIDSTTINDIEISCMCSGNGEDIIMMNLAHYLVNNIMDCNQDEEGYGSFVINLIQTHGQRFQSHAINDDNESIIYVGVILFINHKHTDEKRLIYCHSTPSFYFGFTHNEDQVEVIQSRLNNTDKFGKIFTTGEFKL